MFCNQCLIRLLQVRMHGQAYYSLRHRITNRQMDGRRNRGLLIQWNRIVNRRWYASLVKPLLHVVSVIHLKGILGEDADIVRLYVRCHNRVLIAQQSCISLRHKLSPLNFIVKDFQFG